MAEHEPHGAPFDEQAVAEALNTRSATVRDVAYGEGVQYSVGRGDARLEVYPRTGVTRLTARDVRIELFGSKVSEVSPGGVEFSRTQPGQDASLTVVPGGGIVFTLVAGGKRRPPIQPEPHTTPPSPTPPPLTGPETAQERGDLGTGLHSSPPTQDAPRASQAAQEPAPPSP